MFHHLATGFGEEFLDVHPLDLVQLGQIAVDHDVEQSDHRIPALFGLGRVVELGSDVGSASRTVYARWPFSGWYEKYVTAPTPSFCHRSRPRSS